MPTDNWANIGQANQGKIDKIYLGKSDTIYNINSVGTQVHKIAPTGVVTSAWLNGSDLSLAGAEVIVSQIIVNKTSGDVYVLYTESGFYKVAKVTPEKTITKEWAKLASSSISNRYRFIQIAVSDIYLLNDNTDIEKVTSSGGNPTLLRRLTYRTQQPGADASGNMFFYNGNKTISKVTTAGAETANWATCNLDAGSGTPPVTDASGNVYVVETDNLGTTNLLKFTSAGGAAASTTSLGDVSTRRISIDASGNMYMLDEYSNRIMKVSSAGTLTASFATLPLDRYAQGLTVVDGSNNLYISNSSTVSIGSDIITKITSSAVVTPRWVDMGDPFPQGITRDVSGNLFVANIGNSSVSRITAAGVVTPVWARLSVDAKPRYVVADKLGNVFTSNTNNTVSKINSSGSVLANVQVGAALTQESDSKGKDVIALDKNGNLYIGVQNGTSSKISKIAVNTTTATTLANLSSSPRWIAVDTARDILYTANVNKTISRVALTNPNPSTNTVANWASLSSTNPQSIVVNATNGNVYTLNYDGSVYTISKIASDGALTENFASLSGSEFKQFIIASNGFIYVLDQAGKAIILVKDDGTTESVITSGDGFAQATALDEAGIVYDNVSSFYIPTNKGNVARVQVRPKLNTVTISSDNTISTRAKLSNKITLSFTSSEAINTPTVSIAGASATVTNLSGNTSWKAELTVGVSSPTGVASFLISNIVSTATSITGSDVSATTNSSSVRIDTITPILSTVTIVSNNSNTAKAKVGDKVTLNFSSSEAIRRPTVTIGNQAATITNLSVPASDSATWRAELTMLTSNTQAQGQIGFSIAISDSAGNARTVTATTNSSRVVYDTVRPSFTTVAIASNGSNTSIAGPTDSVTISFTVSEGLGATPTVAVRAGGQTIQNPVQVRRATGNNWTAGFYLDQANDLAGAITFTISNAADTTGNVSASVSSTTNGSSVTFVKSKPTLSSVTISSNNTTNARRATTGNIVTLNFTASEAINSPIVRLTTLRRTVTATNSSGDKLNWQATYTTVSGDPEDSVTVLIVPTSVYNITGDSVKSTTNGSCVLFDKTRPSLSSVVIVSNNSINTARVTTGDSVTISFTTSELLSQKPSVSIAGQVIPASNVKNTSGNNWTGGYKFLGTETEDTVRFFIAYIDSAGIKGDTVRTTSNSSRVIFDKTKPTLSSVAIVSNNSINTARAKTGDSVTVSFTANESLSQKPSVSIAGQVIPASNVKNTSGNNWTGGYKFLGTETEDTVRFFIAYIDSAGIKGDTVRTTSNSSRVIFDKTKPILSSVAIVSNNPINTARAKTGDSVTVSFTSNESLSQKPSVSIAGQVIPASNVKNTSGNNWTGGYKFLGTETEDTIRFFIAYIDSAGIKGDTVRTTSNSSRVIFDKTKPTLSSVAIISSNPTNTSRARIGDSVTVSFTSNESLSQKPSVSIAGQVISQSNVTNISGNSWKGVYKLTGVEAEDTVRFYLSVLDSANNRGDTVTTTTNSSTVIFDKTAPLLSTVSILSNNINSNRYATTGDSVTLNFTSAEPILSPNVVIAGQSILSANVVNVSGNNWKAVYKTQAGDAAGNIGFQIAYKDAIGNLDTVRNTTNNSKVIFDKSPPTLTAVSIVSNSSNQSVGIVNSVLTLNFTASEGILLPTVSIAGSTVTPTFVSGSSWKATYTLKTTDTEGQIPFTINYKDSAGIAGVMVDTTTDGSKVIFDKSALVLNLVSISSNNSTDTSHATTGDIITLRFRSSREINTPTVLLAGQTVTATNVSGDKINWNAIYTMRFADAEGAVSLRVDFSDLAGNAGLAVTGTSNNTRVLFDKTTPTLTSVGILSTNTNTAKAKVGDTIRLNIVSGEGIMTPVVTIAGSSASVTNISLNTWRASYTIQAADAEGSIPFSIAYKDSAGLSGTVVTATTNNSGVLLDKTLPTLSSVSIISNNANTIKAKVGDTVILSFTSSEGLLTPVVTISGQTANIAQQSARNWSASYVMRSTDVEGNIPFNISFRDSAFNSGNAVTATSNSSSVLFDKTPPQLTSVSITSNSSISINKASVGNIITVSFTSNEPLLTPVVTIAGQSASVSIVSGNTWRATYTLKAADTEGNVPFSIGYQDVTANSGGNVTVTTDNSNVLFDRTAPKLTSVSIASNNSVFNGNAIVGNEVTVSLQADEAIDPPIVTIAGRSATVINASGDKVNWKATYTMVAADAEGSIPFSIAFKDLLANTGTIVTATLDNSKVFFDKTSPGLTSVNIASNNAVVGRAKIGDQISLRFVSSEPLQPPVVTISGKAASVNGSGRNWTAVYTMQNADSEGNVSFNIIFRDSSGISGLQVATVTEGSNVVFDKTDPVLNSINISSNNADIEKAQPGDIITVNFTSNESLRTPIVNIVGRSVIATNVSGNSWTASYVMTSRDVADVQSYSIVYTDLAGNKGVARSASSTITSICPTSFPFTWNGRQYNAIGRYSIGLTNSEGADSTASLILRLHPVPPVPVIIRSASTFCTGDSILLESSSVLNNQWMLNGREIVGATSKFLTTKEVGFNSYTVRVTNNLNCYAVSNPVAIQYLSTEGTKISIRDTMVCKGRVVPVSVESPHFISSYSWRSASTGFTASTKNVNLVNHDKYTVTIRHENGCVVVDTINFKTTADTAIKARIIMSRQAFVNQQVKAVNLTNSRPQSQNWVLPTGADIVSRSDDELVVRFANPGTYAVYLTNTSYDICKSSDTATIIITRDNQSNVASTNKTIIRNITIGPNPTTGRFRVSVDLNRPGKTSLRIYDFNGTPVFQNIYQESSAKFFKDIDISAQPSQRTYVLVAQTDGGYEIRTIIKN